MYIYIVAWYTQLGQIIPAYFFHSFQEAEDTCKPEQIIVRMCLGQFGWDLYMGQGTWQPILTIKPI